VLRGHEDAVYVVAAAVKAVAISPNVTLHAIM
jgi:hypothetical protein